MSIAVVILDEAAHFYGRDGSPLDVAELWDAIKPATLDFPDRRLDMMSTPKWSAGGSLTSGARQRRRVR